MLKTATGHEIEVAWNKERLDVVIAIDPKHPLSDHWISLSPEEARTFADLLRCMAQACDREQES